MSLAIDTNDVTAVLLADGWHEVDDASFDIDSYEFFEGKGPDRFLVHGGGHYDICASGFVFTEPGSRALVSGPLTAVLAVRYQRRT